MTQPKFHVTSELSPQRVIFTSKEYNSGLKFQQKKMYKVLRVNYLRLMDALKLVLGGTNHFG